MDSAIQIFKIVEPAQQNVTVSRSRRGQAAQVPVRPSGRGQPRPGPGPSSHSDGAGPGGFHVAPSPANHSSTPRFARRSACLFRSRGTCSYRMRAKLPESFRTSVCRRCKVGFFTLNRPDSCSTIRRLSERSSTSAAPSSAARLSPSIAAVYSATLLVAMPMPRAISATVLPAASVM